MTKYTIEDTTMSRIADSVRDLTFTDEKLTPEQIAETLEHTQLGIPAGTHNHMVGRKWVRPEGWPDLDILKKQIPEGESCVYLTYVLSYCSCGEPWIGIYGVGASYTVERGHIEDGVFVTDESTSHNSGQYHREDLDPANGDVQLWRVRSTGNLTYCKFASKTTTDADNPPTMDQPCVERVGKLPYLTTIEGSTNVSINGGRNHLWSTYYLERDSTDIAGAIVGSGIASAYGFSFSLQELDMNGWDTSNWRPTAIYYMFQYCHSLRELDLSSWNTSNWEVTNLYSMFSCMESLERINVTLDTSNWIVSNIGNLFFRCASLRELDLSNWDTSKWAITTFGSTFAFMLSLESLDLSSWDVSGWPLNGNVTYNWQFDFSLRELDLSGWDTSNWATTNTGSNFQYCHNLRKCSVLDFGQSSGNIGIPNEYMLTDYGGRRDIYVTHSYRNCPFLTHESLVNILTALPEVTNSPDLQLGAHNLHKLTEDEISIATNKGWDVIS